MTPISPEQQLKLMSLLVDSLEILRRFQDDLMYLHSNSHRIREKDAKYLTHILENNMDSFLQSQIAVDALVTGMKWGNDDQNT